MAIGLPTEEERKVWGEEAVGSTELNAYLQSSNTNLPEVVVAVIDSGVDADHEIFKPNTANYRIIDSGINTSDSGVRQYACGRNCHSEYPAQCEDFSV